MELQNRIGFIVRLALIAAFFAAASVQADPKMERVVPSTLTLSIGGDSKLLAFSGKDLQLVKEVTVASAAPDHFSLTLGPVSADGADRQLLIKANADAAPGIYRLRILFTTRGGLLLHPRMIKLKVLPADLAEQLADKRKDQAIGPERQVTAEQKIQRPRPVVAEPEAMPNIRQSAPQVKANTLNDETPVEPEVIDENGRLIAKETPPSDRGGKVREEQDPIDKSTDSFSRRSASSGAVPDTVSPDFSGRLPEGSRSAAMLAEAMGERSAGAMSAGEGAVAVPRGNIMPAEANRSSWIKFARKAGDTPRLALLAPAGQKSFMRGYFAPVEKPGPVEKPMPGDRPRPKETKLAEESSATAAGEAPPKRGSLPSITSTKPEIGPASQEGSRIRPLPPAVPPVVPPEARPTPVVKPKIPSAPKPSVEQPVVVEPVVDEPGSKDSGIVSNANDSDKQLDSRRSRSATGAKPAEPTATGEPGVAVGMRALPVYWIRGMAPTAMLVGSVRNAQTGEPVEGAELQLGSMVAKTTAAGLYSLPSEDESRQLKIAAEGYLPVQITAPRQSGAQMDEVDVSLIPLKPVARDKKLPDLMVVSPPTNPLCRGDKQRVRVRVFNAGRKPVKDYDVTLFTRQWRDGGSPKGVNDDPISIDGPALGAGETRVVDVPVFIAADSLWAEMTAEVDAKSRYDELLETNNRSNPRRIVVASLPDCANASAKLPDFAMLPSLSIVETDGLQGCQLETAVTLANYSNKPAPPVAVTLEMNSAGDLIFSKTLQLKGLAAAEQRDLRYAAPVDALLRALSRSLTLPSLLPDQRMTLSVEVNAELEQDERFTTNNRVEFSGRLSEFIATENLLYRKRGETCLAKL